MENYTFSGKLMGSDLSVEIVGLGRAAAEGAFRAARAAGDALEARCSRFRPESELSGLNRDGAAEVSTELFALVELARRLSEETGGAFNPLVQIARFGYDEDIAAVAGRERAARPDAGNYSADWSTVELDTDARRIQLGAGQALDFGGFLKGYAAERLARAIVASGATGAVVNIGGDLYAVGHDERGAPFEAAVFDPVAGEHRFVVPAANLAVATSGGYRRRWTVGGVEVAHILDGGGDRPARGGLASATVAHPDGARAEALATAAAVLGAADSPALLERLGAADWILVAESGAVTRKPKRA